MGANRPAIGSAIASTGSHAQRYDRNFQTGNGIVVNPRGYSPVKDHSGSVINNPIQGGVGSQSQPPRGVQSPGNGFPGGAIPDPYAGGLGGAGGAGPSGAPQNGGGDVAKSENPNTGATTSKPDSTLPAGNSPNDFLTQALLQKMLNDRKTGDDNAVKRDDKGKVESIDQSKIDEKTKAEIAKLSEAFQKDAKDLEQTIKEFKTKHADKFELSEEDKRLEGILDRVVKEANSDSMKQSITDKDGNKIDNPKFNPQKFIDAANELDEWVKANAGPDGNAAKYGKDLTDINDKVQSMKESASSQIALAENNPVTLLATAQKAAQNSQEAATELKDKLSKSDFKDDPKVKDFSDETDKAMKVINPSETESYNPKQAELAMDELSKKYNELPEEVLDDPTNANAFNEIKAFAKNAHDIQVVARTEEPKIDEHHRDATEVIQGADQFDANEHKYREEQREPDIRALTGDDLADKFKAEAEAKKSEAPETSKAESSPGEKLMNLSDPFPEEEVDPVQDPLVRGDHDSNTDTALDKLAEDSTDSINEFDDLIAQIDEPDIDEIDIPEVDLGLDELLDDLEEIV